MDFDNLVKGIHKLQDVNPELCQKLKEYVYDIQGCCIEVHRELGPFLNEYIYQEGLQIILDERQIPFQKEFYFSVDLHGKRISHKHYVDFLVRDNVFVECKAIANIGPEQRQQLWNYMRLSGIRIGILYNFAPYKDQHERYYLDTDNQVMYMF